MAQNTLVDSAGHKITLGRTLGAGQYGKAILSASADGSQVVVKQVHISNLSKEQQMEAINEVKVMQELDHLNIVRYIDCLQQDGSLWIVMEYCRYGELSGLIANRAKANKPFTEQEIMFWFVQVALALWQLHSKNILHRDLKSQNIFISEGAILKLGDFGIARVLNSDTELVKTAIGTPYYLSPEICQDQPYNRKSDCWALGCVLYELASLRRAFDGGSLPALVVKILRGRYPSLPSRYSTHLRGLVDALLQQDPRARPSIDTILRMDYVKGHLARYAQHVMRLSQTPGAIRINPLAASRPGSSSNSNSSSTAGGAAAPSAGGSSDEAAAASGRRLAGAQAVAPASAKPGLEDEAAAAAAAGTSSSTGSAAGIGASGKVDSNHTGEVVGLELSFSSSSSSNVHSDNSVQRLSSSSSTGDVLSSSTEHGDGEDEHQSEDGAGSDSSSASPGEQQVKRGLLGTGWLERQQAAFDELQAAMAALPKLGPRSPKKAAAAAGRQQEACLHQLQQQQEQHGWQQQQHQQHQHQQQQLQFAAAAQQLATPGKHATPTRHKQSPAAGSKQSSSRKPCSGRKSSSTSSKAKVHAAAKHAAAASPAHAVAAARAARLAEKETWKQQQAREAADLAAKRAARAAELEIAHRDKLAAAQRQQEEAAAAASAHRQHMKGVQPRLLKEQLAELGAAFKQRMESQMGSAASSAGGVVVSAGGDDDGAGGAAGSGDAGAGQLLVLQQSAGGQALLVALNDAGTAGASGGVRPRSGGSSRTGGAAGLSRGGSSSVGGSAVQSAAASRRSTPEREGRPGITRLKSSCGSNRHLQQDSTAGNQAAAAVSPPAEKPWKAARRHGPSAGLGVEIYCPYGTHVQDDVKQQQQQQQQQTVELTFAGNLPAPLLLPGQPGMGNESSGCSDEDPAGDGMSSPQMQRVLCQIHSALVPAPCSTGTDAGGGSSAAGACHDALDLPPEVVVGPLAELPATAAAGPLLTGTAGSNRESLGTGVAGGSTACAADVVANGAANGVAGSCMPVAQRIEALRCMLEKSLGQDVLVLAYRYVEAMEQASLAIQPDDSLVAVSGVSGGDACTSVPPSYELLLSELLGPEKLHLVLQIHKLLMLESQAFGK